MVADYDYTLFRKKKDTRRSSVLLLGLVSFLQNRHLSRLQLNHLIRYDFRPLHLKYRIRMYPTFQYFLELGWRLENGPRKIAKAAGRLDGLRGSKLPPGSKGLVGGLPGRLARRLRFLGWKHLLHLFGPKQNVLVVSLSAGSRQRNDAPHSKPGSPKM